MHSLNEAALILLLATTGTMPLLLGGAFSRRAAHPALLLGAGAAGGAFLHWLGWIISF